MKNWRPDNWHEYNRTIWNAYNLPDEVFEAGANAMLEALKKKGTLMTPEQMKLIAPDREYPFGYLVFIPDDD